MREQAGYMPESEKEKTTPYRAKPKREIGKMPELVKIESAQGRFISGEALFRKQEIRGGKWEDKPGQNQDTFLSDSKRGIFGVFDGIGGLAQGAEASAAARDAFQEEISRGMEQVFRLGPKLREKFAKSGEDASGELEKLQCYVEETLSIELSRFASAQDVARALVKGAEAASKAIAKEAPQGDTTVSLMAVYETADGELKGKIINRGDSRVYIYRGENLEQLTKDDSIVSFLFDKGLIKDPDNLEEELSDAAREFIKDTSGVVCRRGDRVKDIRHYVTAGLAVEKQAKNARVTDVDLEYGDLIVCATDGIVDNLSDESLKEIIQIGNPATDRPDTIADNIAKEARIVAQDNGLRAKPDDMSVIVSRVRESPMLEDFLENHYAETKEFVGGIKHNKLLADLTFTLSMARNQAEFAVESNPHNKKLEMLRDHIVSTLRLVGDRQAELRREAAEDTILKRKKRPAA